MVQKAILTNLEIGLKTIVKLNINTMTQKTFNNKNGKNEQTL